MSLDCMILVFPKYCQPTIRKLEAELVENSINLFTLSILLPIKQWTFLASADIYNVTTYNRNSQKR